MSTLSCPDCGNTRQWADLVMDQSGIRAQCGHCGQVVTSSRANSDGPISMSDLTVTGPAVFGEDATVVGQRRPADRPAPRPAAEPRYEMENGQRYLVIDGRRWAVREPVTAPAAPAPRPAAEPRYEMENGQRYLVIDGRRWAARAPATPPTNPTPTNPAPRPLVDRGPGPATRPEPPTTATTSPWSSPPETRTASTPTAPATANVPSEITGLLSAQRYAQGMSAALAGQASNIEIFVGVLSEADVSGDAVTFAVRAKELTGQASQAWQAADTALARQHTVREAYGAVPDAGTKSWLQQG